MDIKEQKTVDMLTQDSVSILTQKFIEVDGEFQQVGKNHRRAYENSEVGRDAIQSEQPSDVVNSVLARWGDKPTVIDPIKKEEA